MHDITLYVDVQATLTVQAYYQETESPSLTAISNGTTEATGKVIQSFNINFSMHAHCMLNIDTTEAAPQSPSKLSREFGSLSPEKLSKHEKEQLHQRLFADSEDMMYKFQILFTNTTDSLREQNIPVTELTRHLELLGSVKPTYTDAGLPPLRHQLTGLTDAKTIKAAMSVVKDYCSFFNYRMLEHIINNLGTEQDKLNLAKYKEDFAEYGERHVFQCPSEVGRMIKDHTSMIVTLDDSFDNCSINHLQSFISNLRKTLNISSEVELRLCRIESGSIKLTFQLPFYVMKAIFPLSHEQETHLAVVGVVLLSCGDYQYNTVKYKV